MLNYTGCYKKIYIYIAFRVVSHVNVPWLVIVLSVMRIQECVGVNPVLLVEHVIDVNLDIGIIPKMDAYVI